MNPVANAFTVSMKRYITKRLLLIIFTLFGLITIVFLISRVAPGDPARLAAGPDATEEMVEVMQKEFGLDRPFLVQYLSYFKGLASGNLGLSIRTRHKVLDDLIRFFPATFELTIFSLLLAVVLAIPLGVLCAVYRDRFLDHAARVFSVSGMALPMFWLALMLQLFLALKFDFLPLGGRLGLLTEPPAKITHLYLVDSLLTGNWLVFKDALLHMTMIGLRYGWMLGGTILVETVFDWPGIGLYAVQSAIYSDFQPIMGVTLIIGINFMVVNLIIDLTYGILDPRVRYD
jgi:peptide/nickel transport system permease protein